MENLNEKLLGVWLSLTSIVNHERIVSSMSFNEAHVCNLLYRQRQENPAVYLTATELCTQTRMLKSQMNKVLTSLEKRGMIDRFPAPEDRRKAYIRLREETMHEFESVHARSIQLVDYAIEKLGVDTARQLTEILSLTTGYMDEALTLQQNSADE